MISFTQGNLLDSSAEALVNTVNTLGVMGKGIALMFKEAFPENYRAYAAACKAKEVRIGYVFVTERQDWIGGPRWIVNFPTKANWRFPSRIEWIERGLVDLRRFIVENHVRSIALPPLGSGNGGLEWKDVRPLIESELGSLVDVSVVVYEPTEKYQNVAKRAGVEELTPARALVAELVRRYSVLGFECTLLEIYKLAYLLEQVIERLRIDNPLKLQFQADKYGPYAPRLGHLLNSLDGSYLHCVKRVADADISDTIWFEDKKRQKVALYMSSSAYQYLPALETTTSLIRGFESPLGMELLSTVDWLVMRDKVDPTVEAIKGGLRAWLGGGKAAERKVRLFEDRLLALALDRLVSSYQGRENTRQT